MTFYMSMSDLAQMPEKVRNEHLAALIRNARENPEAGLHVINVRVGEFERRYEMSSKEMLAKLSGGAIKETAEIAQWLFFLDARATHHVPE